MFIKSYNVNPYEQIWPGSLGLLKITRTHLEWSHVENAYFLYPFPNQGCSISVRVFLGKPCKLASKLNHLNIFYCLLSTQAVVKPNSTSTNTCVPTIFPNPVKYFPGDTQKLFNMSYFIYPVLIIKCSIYQAMQIFKKSLVYILQFSS